MRSSNRRHRSDKTPFAGCWALARAADPAEVVAEVGQDVARMQKEEEADEEAEDRSEQSSDDIDPLPPLRRHEAGRADNRDDRVRN